MNRALSPLAAAFVLAVLTVFGGAARAGDEDEARDLSGVWESIEEALVVHRTGPRSFIGRPTEGRAALSGRTWRFEFIGGAKFQFWIMLEGKATTVKSDEQELTLTEERDLLEMMVTPPKGDRRKKVRFRRTLARIPERIGEVTITHVSPKRVKVSPDQYVDIRLVAALRRAVETARAADPGLKRLNVAGTIDWNVGKSRRHSRFVRRAADFDMVNGAGRKHWREDVDAKLEFLKKGEEPDVDPRRDYARHAAALVLALLIEEEVDEVVCPAILDESTVPYLEWWLRQYGGELPDRAPSPVVFAKKIRAMLDATGTQRRSMKGGLHVAVRGPETRLRFKNSREKRYDRE